MARVDIVHDADGNVHGFTVHSESKHQTGVKVQEGQTVTSAEIPGHPKEDPKKFAAAVHSHLRKRLEG